MYCHNTSKTESDRIFHEDTPSNYSTSTGSRAGRYSSWIPNVCGAYTSDIEMEAIEYNRINSVVQFDGLEIAIYRAVIDVYVLVVEQLYSTPGLSIFSY
jgi:hypothetical protein